MGERRSGLTPRTFDRRVDFDSRSRLYPIRTLLAAPYASPWPRSYTWRCGTVLDQGREGACVGFGWAHELAARPVVVPGVTANSAQAIYRHAQRIDVWEGEDYEGTSVLAGAKAVQAGGYMDEYRWAFGLDDLRLAVGSHGPAVIGVNWYAGMFDTDSAGYVRVTGDVVGGHCVVVHGVSQRTGRFRIRNSWGPDWGVNGEAWVSFDDMARLLGENGEAVIPVWRKR